MAQEIADSTLLDTWASGGNIEEPDISKIIEGWQLGEQPPHEYMNWLQNTFGSKLNHILKNGVASWNDEKEFLAGATTQHSGNVWLCKATNTNSVPTDANSNWKRILTVESLADLSDDYVALTGNQAIAGVKTFSNLIVATTTANFFSEAGLMVNGNGSANTVFPSISFHQPGWYAGMIALTSDGRFCFFKGDGITKGTIEADLIGNAATVTNGVYTTGDQAITGVKTFSSSPIVPTPTTGEQAVNKDYADLKVALTDFIGTNQSLSENGYQKLPGGLIIQWTQGVCSATPNTPVAVNLPITFPNGILRFFATAFPVGSYVSCPNATNSSVSITSNIAGAGASVFAIGY